MTTGLSSKVRLVMVLAVLSAMLVAVMSAQPAAALPPDNSLSGNWVSKDGDVALEITTDENGATNAFHTKDVDSAGVSSCFKAGEVAWANITDRGEGKEYRYGAQRINKEVEDGECKDKPADAQLKLLDNNTIQIESKLTNSTTNIDTYVRSINGSGSNPEAPSGGDGSGENPGTAPPGDDSSVKAVQVRESPSSGTRQITMKQGNIPDKLEVSAQESEGTNENPGEIVQEGPLQKLVVNEGFSGDLDVTVTSLDKFSGSTLVVDDGEKTLTYEINHGPAGAAWRGTFDFSKCKGIPPTRPCPAQSG